jgi:hypothetical protein
LRLAVSYSKTLFLIGVATALILTILPILFEPLRTSDKLDLFNLILFPPSLLLSITETASSTVGHAVITVALVVLNGFTYGLVGLALDRVIPVLVANDFHQIPPTRLSDLPIWKAVLIVVALGFFLFVSARAVDEDLTTFAKAPDHPVPAAGQVYPVSVEHGYTRYLTASEKASFDVWDGVAVTWGGAAFLCACFLYITSVKKTDNRHVR